MNTCLIWKNVLGAVSMLLVVCFANAQPGCPAINAGNDVSLPCSVSCTTLHASAFQTGGTDAYNVSQISYTPFSYTTGTPVLIGQDDIWSNAITIPFNFCFFGNSYNQLVIGANGLISFDITEAGNTCAWQLTTAGPLPTSALYTNSIMGPYHDIDPTYYGTTTYQITGSAPCRIFTVSWDHVPYYGDSNSVYATDFPPPYLCGPHFATQQIVLYETTNAIEIYIQAVDDCAGWNGGLAVEGIQNSTGTTAYTVPGRNNTVWSAHNDAWRFTPSGPSIVNVSWYQGATQISTDSIVQVCPTASTTYTAQAVYTPCSGGNQITVSDSVVVSLASNFVAAIDSSKNISCFGANNGKAYAHVSGGTPPITYGWSNGSGNPSITNLSPGTYIFTASDANNCVKKDTVIITQPGQLSVTVPNSSQTNCSGPGTGSLTANASGGSTPYHYAWNTGPTTPTLSGINPVLILLL